MTLQIKILGPGDEGVLGNVAPGVFDRAINPRFAAEFLADPRHHLAVAIDDNAGGVVVGFVSAVHYVNPDKPPEMWINEVGVAPAYRQRGVARSLLRAILERARTLRCREAWVLTDRSNVPAMRLYASAGASEPPRDQEMFAFKLD